MPRDQSRPSGTRRDQPAGSLQQVELLRPSLRRPRAFVAQPVHFHAVPLHAEAMLAGDVVQDLSDSDVIELNQLAAAAADQVIVGRIAVVVLENLASILSCD